MTYVYVRKDLTFIQNPASQTLLKSFLKSLYDDQYIPSCEEEFGFVRVTGDLRQKALDAIDALVVSDGAPEWTFETETEARTGQGDYVISVKRDSYSEIEQNLAVAHIDELTAKLDALQKEYDALVIRVSDLDGLGDLSNLEAAEGYFDESDDQDTQLKTALALASVSFILWMLAIIGVLVKFVLHL